MIKGQLLPPHSLTQRAVPDLLCYSIQSQLVLIACEESPVARDSIIFFKKKWIRKCSLSLCSFEGFVRWDSIPYIITITIITIITTLMEFLLL